MTIQGNEIAQTGGSGIYIGGNATLCCVLDNEVHDCAVFDKYSAGIEFPFYGGTAADVGPRAYTHRITIAHNYVHDVPRDGIQLGANPYGRNVVEFNRVERAASETIDAGAIRCHRVVSHLWGIAPMPPMTGHVIRNNVVLDTRGCGGSRTGGSSRPPSPGLPSASTSTKVAATARSQEMSCYGPAPARSSIPEKRTSLKTTFSPTTPWVYFIKRRPRSTG